MKLKAHAFGRQEESILANTSFSGDSSKNLERSTYVDPPYSFHKLLSYLRKNETHESAIDFKAGAVVHGYKPHASNQFAYKEEDTEQERAQKNFKFNKFFPFDELLAVVLDHITFGNSFICPIELKGYDIEEKIGGLKHQPALITRKANKTTNKGNCITNVDSENEKRIFSYHLYQKCPESNIYGIPNYVGVLNKMNMAYHATESRDEFYEKRGKVGGILAYSMDFDDINPETGNSPTEEAIKKLLKDHINGKKDHNLLVLNFGEAENTDIQKLITYINTTTELQKDDYKITIDKADSAVLSAHRIYPELMGNSAGNVGVDLNKLSKGFSDNIISPIQRFFLRKINSFLPPERWIDFDPFYQEPQS